MRLKNLLKESEEKIQPLPKDKKDRLRNVLSSIFDVIERFEKGGSIDDKNSKEKIELLRDTISSMIKEEDRKKVIRGDG